MTAPTPAQALAKALHDLSFGCLPPIGWGGTGDSPSGEWRCDPAVHEAQAAAILANLDPRSLLSPEERQALADGEELAALPARHIEIHRHSSEWSAYVGSTTGYGWDSQGHAPTIAAAARAARERLETAHAG